MKTNFKHKKGNSKLFWILGIIGWLSLSQTFAAIIYVKYDAVGSNNGTSWANAFTDLEDALSVAQNGDEIWVAKGVYRPSRVIDPDTTDDIEPFVSFEIPEGVRLLGGFIGIETTENQRNWQINTTILSGDVGNDDVNLDGNFILERRSDLIGTNAVHILYAQDLNKPILVDGFIITAANALSPFNWVSEEDADIQLVLTGGGAFFRNLTPNSVASINLKNCTFQGNYATAGGGAVATIYIDLVIYNCKFLNNSCLYGLGGAISGYSQNINILNSHFAENLGPQGGGAGFLVGDNITIQNSKFKKNKTVFFGSEYESTGSGGALQITPIKNLNIENTIFYENMTYGARVAIDEIRRGGGAVSLWLKYNNVKAKFNACGFYNNHADGDIGNSNDYTSSGGAVFTSRLRSDSTATLDFVNCVFSQNTTTENGGAIANFDLLNPNDNSNTTLITNITNCTFVNNVSSRKGGAIFSSSLSKKIRLNVENSILWGNNAGLGGNQIANQNNSSRISYSLIQNSGGSGAFWDILLGNDLGNNLDLNPQFRNISSPWGVDGIPRTSDDGLVLDASSPAINRGNNYSSGLLGVSADYVGSMRVNGSRVELGAYETIFLNELRTYKLCTWKCKYDFLSRLVKVRKHYVYNEFTNLFQEFVWDEQKGTLEVYDNEAIIRGTIIHPQVPNLAFEVFIKLVKPANWSQWSALNRSYFSETEEAADAALKNHSDWMFWEVSNESFMEGTGDVSGKLYLSHAPKSYKTGFQMGLGGNAMIAGLGIGGDFYFQGQIHYQQKQYDLNGWAVLTAEAELLEAGLKNKITPVNLTKQDSFGEKEIKIYPNPTVGEVHFDFSQYKNLPHEVSLYNFNGQLIQTFKPTDKRLKMNLKDYKSGLYIIKIQINDKEIKQFRVQKNE